MNEKETLPPTELDISAARRDPAGAQDAPTRLEGQPGDYPPARPREIPRRPTPLRADQTVLISQEKAEPTLAWLVITAGAPVGQLFTLNPDTTSIGRDRQNDIVLDDEGCSRQHARVKVEREEEEVKFYLFDLASTNGTFVNGEQVYRHQLVDGDRVTIGETELVFKKV